MSWTQVFRSTQVGLVYQDCSRLYSVSPQGEISGSKMSTGSVSSSQVPEVMWSCFVHNMVSERYETKWSTSFFPLNVRWDEDGDGHGQNKPGKRGSDIGRAWQFNPVWMGGGIYWREAEGRDMDTAWLLVVMVTFLSFLLHHQWCINDQCDKSLIPDVMFDWKNQMECRGAFRCFLRLRYIALAGLQRARAAVKRKPRTFPRDVVISYIYADNYLLRLWRRVTPSSCRSSRPNNQIPGNSNTWA